MFFFFQSIEIRFFQKNITYFLKKNILGLPLWPREINWSNALRSMMMMTFIICFFHFYLKKWNSLFAFFIFTFKSNFITCFFSFLLKKWNKSFCFFLIFSLQNMRNDYWNKFFENLICFFLGNCFSFSHEVDRKCFVKRNLCRRWCII